jgi:hypothetical protein
MWRRRVGHTTLCGAGHQAARAVRGSPASAAENRARRCGARISAGLLQDSSAVQHAVVVCLHRASGGFSLVVPYMKDSVNGHQPSDPSTQIRHRGSDHIRTHHTSPSRRAFILTPTMPSEGFIANALGGVLKREVDDQYNWPPDCTFVKGCPRGSNGGLDCLGSIKLANSSMVGRRQPNRSPTIFE